MQPIGDGVVGLVVGDVVGHGIEAIADMTEIRTTVSTLLRTDANLSSVAASSSALLATGGDEVVFATAVLMVVDLTVPVLRYVRAGHPPPMVRHPTARWCCSTRPARRRSASLAGRRSSARSALVPGSVVVAYTDGLVERRDETIDVGIERLRAGLAACAECADVERSPTTLIEHCLGTRSTDDDTALLVVRVETT